MTTGVRRLVLAAGFGLGAAALGLGGGGCEESSKLRKDADAPLVENAVRGKAPAYADAARAYNQNVKLLDRVSARVNILLTYFDDKGEKRTEDPEGRLQIVRPNKLALSLGKAGQTLFWFGCDPVQYWWIDLSDKNDRIAALGDHTKFDDLTARRIGLPIRPLDMIRLMGVVPMDVSARGATQWAGDGSLLGITSPVGDRGFQRVWVDPDTYRMRMIEIYDKSRTKILVAEHEGQERVDIRRDVPGAALAHVYMPSRVMVTHLPTDTTARITLTDVRDGPITDKAFDLKVLLDKYPVDKTLDLDTRRAGGPAGGGQKAQ
jgi:hypothetical protein